MNDDWAKVFAGSADELESQQGMAHLVEHVAYMGSRKRYALPYPWYTPSSEKWMTRGERMSL